MCSSSLVVLAPGLPAGSAAEEPDFALICRPQLAQPPVCRHAAALRALDGRSRKGRDIVLCIDDGDLLFNAFIGLFQIIEIVDLSDIAALFAFQLTTGRYHQAFAPRTKHHYNKLGADQN